jgi:hypothetical protein
VRSGVLKLPLSIMLLVSLDTSSCN